MQKILSCFLFFFALTTIAQAQNREYIIQKKEVGHIIKTLAADSMKGRAVFSSGIKKAADFIVKKFKQFGLEPMPGNDDFRQQFKLIKTVPQKISVQVKGQTIPPTQVAVISSQKYLHWTAASSLAIDTIEAGARFFRVLRQHIDPNQNTLIWVDTSYATQFRRLKRYLSTRKTLPDSTATVFIMANAASDFDISIQNKRMVKTTANIVGVLPGDIYPSEKVIFGAHYDHLGVAAQPINGDRIYNGANDNASGTTAVIELAKYFSVKGGNNRTLIFVAFTAEEIGLVGSQYFSKKLNPENIVAMFNIEMIGTRSKWGKNSVYITGFNKSNFGQILQENVKGSFKFHPGPYQKRHLFYRSDNATLARLGVPAHTISTAQMKHPEHYHKVSDEVSKLDIANMTRIIRAIADAAEGIVNGEDTPTRVDPASL